MLCEALIHMLLDKGLLDRDEVCETIEGLEEIKQEMAGRQEPADVGQVARGLLLTLRLSLTAR